MDVEIGADRVLVTPVRPGPDGLSYATAATDRGEVAVAYTDHRLVTDPGDLTWLRVRAADLVRDLADQGVAVLLLDPSTSPEDPFRPRA